MLRQKQKEEEGAIELAEPCLLVEEMVNNPTADEMTSSRLNNDVSLCSTAQVMERDSSYDGRQNSKPGLVK